MAQINTIAKENGDFIIDVKRFTRSKRVFYPLVLSQSKLNYADIIIISFP